MRIQFSSFRPVILATRFGVEDKTPKTSSTGTKNLGHVTSGRDTMPKYPHDKLPDTAESN